MANCQEQKIHHYFVDEAGDTTLFAKGGKVLVGTPGCSHTFMLGLAKIANPEHCTQELEKLRAALLADPYFKGVPSILPEIKKTAYASTQKMIYRKYVVRSSN